MRRRRERRIRICSEAVKKRLILGTINYYVAEDGWRNVHVDASSRPIWHPVLQCGVPVDYVMDAAQLTFAEASFDEVRMHHTLEHLTVHRAGRAVRHVFRVLKPGGVFDVEVPDLDRMCAAWLNCHEDRQGLLQWFYSEDVEGVLHEPLLNAHLSGWNEELLGAVLSDAGFVAGDRLETGLALRYRAVKPA